MRVFITGSTGFAGSHLLDILLDDSFTVYALVHPESGHQPLPQQDNLHVVQGDLRHLESIEQAMQVARPETIFHLAGQASVTESWRDPAFTFAVNSGGTANILEAARRFGNPRVVVVTSAEIYGHISPEQLPLNENTRPDPGHPYGVSKVAAAMLVRIYWRRYGLHVIEARPLNHIGPRQALGFVVPDFASQIASIAAGKEDAEMKVGNLEAERDFTDVRDVARAYLLLAEKGRSGESYIISSGRVVKIGAILDRLIEIAGIEVKVSRDPERYRPLETPTVYGSSEKIRRDTGWRPQIPLSTSLADCLDEWKARLSV